MRNLGFEIISHRGWWVSPSEKNTITAFRRSFAAGYGVETDVRDHNGILVISHDMPVHNDIMSFDSFIELYLSYGAPGTLALNIKADGLQQPLYETLSRGCLGNSFVFDMAVPDALGYLALGVTTYTRHSEMEPTPPFYKQADGVWMDCFEDDWIGAEDIKAHIAAGKKVAIVSPELHRRPFEAMWAALAPVAGMGVAVCTDLPGNFASVCSSDFAG